MREQLCDKSHHKGLQNAQATHLSGQREAELGGEQRVSL